MFILRLLWACALSTAFVSFFAGISYAQVFEVIHPDIDKGGVEVEVLSGFVLEDVDGGEEQSAYEFAVGYGVTSYWKTVFAVEFAQIDGDGLQYEAFEWENVFLFPLGGDDHGHDGEEGIGLEALGFYAALEVPDEGGFDSGALVLGPLAEVRFGPVETIANLFVEVPFESGENEALAYALAASVNVTEKVALGIEAFGEVENVFDSGTESELFIGPAAYFDFELPNGRAVEPRIAVLFGTESEQPDAILSLNLELKF